MEEQKHEEELEREPEKEQPTHWRDQIDNRHARRRRAALDRRHED